MPTAKVHLDTDSMRRLIILVCLLVAHIEHVLSDKTAVIQVIKRSGYVELHVKPPSKPEKCTVETNTGKQYEYKPGSGYLTEDAAMRSLYNCSISVSEFNVKDIGEWQITAYLSQEKNEKKNYKYSQHEKEQKNKTKLQEEKEQTTLVPYVTRFRLYVVSNEVIKIDPPTKIIAFRDHYVRMKFSEELVGITGCIIMGPHKRTVDLFGEDIPTGVDLNGQCGAKILIQDNEHGAWNLRAFVNDSIVYESAFHIKVVDTRKEVQPINLQRGMQGTISVNRDAKFCQLVNPQGVSLPLINGGCTYDIPAVTIYHDGLWTARYGVEGRVAPVEVSFNVTTYEKSNLVARVTPLKDGDVQLLCHLENKYWFDFKFCRFIRPDGEIINVSPGVGNGRYSAHSFQRPEDYFEKDVDCGLTIHVPQAEDYGVWKCEMQELNSNDYAGSILHVRGPTQGRAIDDSKRFLFKSNVEVKRGDRLKIKCASDDVLEYCWMRSPNGTMYSVSTEPKSNTTLLYEGSGLSLGECGAIVQNSSSSDDGVWTCHMGIVDGAEIATTILVTVTDSYVIAERKEIFDDDASQPMISCRIIDDMPSKVVEYCRWIRPDTVGLFTGMNRYEANKFVTRCELRIIGELQENDIGRWTCVVGLAGVPVEEQVDYVVLRQRHNALRLSTIIGIVIGGCILVTVAACILVLHYVRKRRANKPPAYTSKPCLPAYTSEPCLPAKVDITHYDAAEYKY